jgi:membrane protease YdiL (CAAX protease family)
MNKTSELSAALALGWSLLLTMGLLTVGITVSVLFGTSNTAVIVGGVAELLLLLPAARFIARIYGGPDTRQAFALAPASPLQLVIGASLGILLHLPAGYLSELVERSFPMPPAALKAQLDSLTPSSLPAAALMLLAVAVLVPFVEELFFRGALFTPL